MDDIVDLTGDDDVAELLSHAAPPSTAKSVATHSSTNGIPAWEKQQGVRRVMTEYRSLDSHIGRGVVHQVHDLEVVDDDVCRWRFKVKGFDDDIPGGRQLNQDLLLLAQRFGQDHILMEATFPKDYPRTPFFLRVVSPRCVWYTGHVTAGGAICIEALTLAGTANAWTPQYCVESILQVVFTNFIDCESVMVRTASGGGLSGPLRIDLYGQYCRNPLQQYTMEEAKSAFARMEAHHRQNGWGPSNAPSPTAATSTHRPPARARSNHNNTSVSAPPGLGSSSAPKAPRNAPPASNPPLAPSGGSGKASALAQAAARAFVGAPLELPVTWNPRPKRSIMHYHKKDEGESSTGQREELAAEEVPARKKQRRAAPEVDNDIVESDFMDLTAVSCDSPPGSDVVEVEMPGPSEVQAKSAEVLKLEAEKLELQVKLEELSRERERQREEEARAAGSLRLAALPEHWDPMPGDRTEACTVSLDLHAGAASSSAPNYTEIDVLHMIGQGLSREDALAALDCCRGDVDEALLWATVCADKGGAAAVKIREGRRARRERGADLLKEQQRVAAVAAEVETVLTMFEANSKLRRAQVTSIERVQNPLLWTKFCLRRHEVQLAAGRAEATETLLFHGADRAAVALITREGFDTRISNLSGALGAGTYFAFSSEYSDHYAKMPQHDAVASALPRNNALARLSTQLQAAQQLAAVTAPAPAPMLLPAGGPHAPALPAANVNPGNVIAPRRVSPRRANPHLSGPAAYAATRAAMLQRATMGSGFGGGLGLGGSGLYTGLGPSIAWLSAGRRTPVAQASSGGGQPQASYSMLLCRVVLGRLGRGASGLRRPPTGTDSVTSSMSGAKAVLAGQQLDHRSATQLIYAVFDNAQAYPEYIIHYR